MLYFCSTSSADLQFEQSDIQKLTADCHHRAIRARSRCLFVGCSAWGRVVFTLGALEKYAEAAYWAYGVGMTELPPDSLRLLTVLVDNGPMSNKAIFEMGGFQHARAKAEKLIREGYVQKLWDLDRRVMTNSATDLGRRAVAHAKGERVPGRSYERLGTYNPPKADTWRAGQDDFRAVKSLKMGL